MQIVVETALSVKTTFVVPGEKSMRTMEMSFIAPGETFGVKTSFVVPGEKSMRTMKLILKRNNQMFLQL